MDYQTFMNGIALGQITPGPIVITAAFVGYLLYGPIGATIGAIGIFLPSFLMIVGTVPYYDRLGKSARFNMAVKGILCSFVGLLFSVTINFASNMTLDILHMAMAIVALVMLLFGIDILWVFLIGGAVSLLIF
jgi:chromate transporter